MPYGWKCSRGAFSAVIEKQQFEEGHGQPLIRKYLQLLPSEV
jgi:hypothetical protein